jgi:hypothetical protein
MSDNIVKFLMPDGTEVSNDPSFDLQKALQEQLDSTPNKGDAGITSAEQIAQTQTEHLANLQSGQPGVGENAAPSDPHDYIPVTGTPAMATQKEDLKEAREAGADLTNTSVDDADPVDSNAAVAEVRKAEADKAAALQAAREKLGEDSVGDPDVDKSEWSTAQLRYELQVRNAERSEQDQLSTKGISKKSQLADLLKADDERLAAGPEA